MSDLIERLRDRTWGKNITDTLAKWADARVEAADRIAELETENARLKADMEVTLDALFDAIALIGHAMPMETTALIGGEQLVAQSVWQRGHDIMFPRRAALKETSHD